MAKLMEYRKGRYVNPSRIISANVYRKDEIDTSGIPTGRQIIKVAFDLDCTDINQRVIYSDAFPTIEAAHNYILDLPIDL